jgi:hypothetical protein
MTTRAARSSCTIVCVTSEKKLDAGSLQPLKSHESLIVIEILSSTTLHYYYNNNSKTKRSPQTENIVY